MNTTHANTETTTARAVNRMTVLVLAGLAAATAVIGVLIGLLALFLRWPT